MNNSPFAQEIQEKFDLRSILLKYGRFWYWFIITLLISLGIAYVYLQYSTPIFKISSVVLIKNDKKTGVGSSDDILQQLDLSQANKVVENEIEILKSRSLAKKVIDELNLTVSYFAEGRFRDTELFNKAPIWINYISLTNKAFTSPCVIHTLDQKYFEILDTDKNILGKYQYGQLINNEFGKLRVLHNGKLISKNQLVKVQFIQEEKLIGALSKSVQVELLNPKSTVLQLSIEQAIPEKGKVILAKLMQLYSYGALEDKNQESTNTLRFIEGRLKLINTELMEVEGEVEVYKSQKGITDLSEEANLFLQQVKESDSRLNEVDVQLRILDGVEKYLKSNQRGIAPATLMVTDLILNSFLVKLSELELQYDQLSRTTQDKNPFLQTLNIQIKNIKQAILENVDNQKKGLIISKSNFKNLNNKYQSSIRSIPKKEREFVSIKRQQSIKENLYLLLLQKREETALSYASTVTDSKVVDEPYSTLSPIKPNAQNIYLIALLIGLVLPASIINLRELLNDKVQSRKDIELAIGSQIFGEIGLKPKDSQGAIVDLKSRSFLSEQFRILRTNLQYVVTDADTSKGKVFLFTSSTSGEGKSFVSINLAASLAMLGKKVALVELDLRKPKISSYLGLPRDKGISNYLVGQLSEKEIIQPTKIENLFLLSSGPIPPNPAELLSTNKIGILINSLKENYDYVILDTPPIGLVTDGVILGQYADSCFYLVRHEVTPKANLTILSNLIQSGKFKSLNVIFNGVNYKNSHEYGYGYSYGYGYGNGKGYY